MAFMADSICFAAVWCLLDGKEGNWLK